ncbi:MAG: methyl-accepting chemotaxis protein [Deltaproteobacteria bacterium]|nr:methyl-accepting chemotaxis protein [Deltaproteobacteria bacterium]
MKKKSVLPSSIKGRLIFYFGITVTLVVLFIVAAFSRGMYRTLIHENDQLIKAHTREIANKIEAQNLEAVSVAKAMALAQKSGLFGNREASIRYARNILLTYSRFTGAYFGYEPNADQNDKAFLEKAGDTKKGLDSKGRFLPYWFLEEGGGGEIKLNPLIDMETSLYYQGSKDNFLSENPEKYMITEPYIYEGKMIVEQTFPIEIDGKFVGIAGVDRALTNIHAYLEGFKPYKSAAFVLLSRKGKIISSTMPLVSQETLARFRSEGKGESEAVDSGTLKRMMTRNLKETDYAGILERFYTHTGPPLLIRAMDPLHDHLDIFSGVRIDTGDWTIVMRVSEHEIISPIKETLLQILLISCVGLLATFLVLLWLAKKISSPITEAVTIARKVSKGDFTVKVPEGADDETGRLLSALGSMIRNLNSLISQVQRSGLQVTSSSNELAAAAKEQEATMSNQVLSTDRVVRSVEGISRVAVQLVDTVEKVVAASDETTGFASRSQADLGGMKEAMHRMEDASRSISSHLESINEKAENVTHVVDTITKVADQTNLLSLNAAIEAEKAGEYGRGFNVVAREIRRLADQTAVATLDIEQMVQGMQSAVSAGVMEMDKFVSEVKGSAEDVGKISGQLAEIIERVQTISPRFEEINLAVGGQSDDALTISGSMTNLKEELQETLESFRETYTAIQQLINAAKGLQDGVSRFKVA